ncbi:tetratricopeptide repeat protein [Bizionia saleffrena]|uniref:histidine kinase n=1 Tax=Bizionia saleffrena TaxID=291189 RepID=A0A8H2QMU2_9FLAO|nr:tetratricopeptide repeat protein [Bizionia saleffrena]TYB78183.1 tetratricopeptide repeat protein [Bizionia saleffrena]
MKYFLFLLGVLLLPIALHSQSKKVNRVEQIYQFHDSAKTASYTMPQRFDYARSGIALAHLEQVDSIVLSSNRVLSYLFIINRDIDSIYPINRENLRLSLRLKDSLRMAYATNNLGYYFQETNVLDSSYYYYAKARKLYQSQGKVRNQASVLLNMAIIQEQERDFMGSEISAIKAVEVLKTLAPSDAIYDLLWSLHNVLGIAAEQLERFDEAIEYHSKAFAYANKMDDSESLRLYTQTNLAILYRRKGDYEKAEQRFYAILKNSALKYEDPSTYSLVMAGLAYCEFLDPNRHNDAQIRSRFKESIAVAEASDFLMELMYANHYYGEYLLDKNERKSAITHINIAHALAKKLNANESVLNTLLLKSKIEDDTISKSYLLDYIQLNDSLVLKERLIRNKFARIDYETDIIKKEKEIISKQRLWLMLISAVLLISLFLVYSIKNHRSRKRELEVAKTQQEANEEIYNLMLSQQEHLNHAKEQEKKRISQDLHDGVLGRLFGTRLSLDSLNFSTTADAIETRSTYIDELKSIEDDIREVSHKLNTDFINQSKFTDIIETLLKTQSTALGLHYRMDVDDTINWDQLSNKTKIHMYRITQESLQNIFKHAEATKVNVIIKLENKNLILEVQDNGKGFNDSKTRKGIGLKNMRDRVSEIDGALVLDSDINTGTIVRITIPYL